MSRETDFGSVEVCPECDNASIQIRVQRKPKYQCQECGYEFSEPLVREALGPTHPIPNNELGQMLWRMDPGEFSERYVPSRYRRDSG